MKTFQILEEPDKPTKSVSYPVTIENLTDGKDEKTKALLKVNFTDVSPIHDAKDAVEMMRGALTCGEEECVFAATQVNLEKPAEGQKFNDFKITIESPTTASDRGDLFVRMLSNSVPICGTRDMAFVALHDAFAEFDKDYDYDESYGYGSSPSAPSAFTEFDKDNDYGL